MHVQVIVYDYVQGSGRGYPVILIIWEPCYTREMKKELTWLNIWTYESLCLVKSRLSLRLCSTHWSRNSVNVHTKCIVCLGIYKSSLREFLGLVYLTNLPWQLIRTGQVFRRSICSPRNFLKICFLVFPYTATSSHKNITEISTLNSRSHPLNTPYSRCHGLIS